MLLTHSPDTTCTTEINKNNLSIININKTVINVYALIYDQKHNTSESGILVWRSIKKVKQSRFSTAIIILCKCSKLMLSGMATISSDRHLSPYFSYLPLSSGRIKDALRGFLYLFFYTRKRKVGVKICRKNTITYADGLTINDRKKKHLLLI